MSTTIILGTGIIGVSTAHYLSQHQPGNTIHLVEASPGDLFASASGYAGGFLAKDWFSAASAALGALSFEEHRRLAESDDGERKWGYAGSTSVSFQVGTGSGKEGGGGGERRNRDTMAAVWCRDGASRAEAANGEPFAGVPPGWLRSREGDDVQVISEEGSVAQVDPLKLSHHLLQKCLSAGVHLHHPARAIAIHTDAMHGELSGVRIATTPTEPGVSSETETDIPCTRLLIAAGAWSPHVFASLFPRSTAPSLPISSLAGHSLVVRSPRWAGAGVKDGGKQREEKDAKEAQVECHAVFIAAPPGDGYAPEIFSRADGYIYVAGLNSAAEPLPHLPADARAGIRREAIEQLRGTARLVLGSTTDGDDDDDDEIEVIREGLCFRPATARGTPILDRIPDAWLGPGVKTRPGAEGGVYLAAGHGPWGISLSLGTGMVMAEMMQGREASADVGGLGFGGLV